MQKKNQRKTKFSIEISDLDFYLETLDLDEIDYDEALVEFLILLLKDTKWHNVIRTRKDISRIPVIHEIASTCYGEMCRYAPKCPVLKALKRDGKTDEAIKNTDCRVDKVQAIRIFSQLIRDLNIGADETMDLLSAVSLVRLYIIRRRIDWIYAIDGQDQDVVSSIAQRSERPYYKKEANPLMAEADKIEKQIANIYSQLMASRKDRAQLMMQLGGKGDLAELFLNTRLGALGGEKQSALPVFTRDAEEDPEEI